MGKIEFQCTERINKNEEKIEEIHLASKIKIEEYEERISVMADEIQKLSISNEEINKKCIQEIEIASKEKEEIKS